MKLSEELKWRGFWNQTTFQDSKVLDGGKRTIYLGADPSADSLHIGHLSVYMMVRRFLDHGHKVVLLIGGGTGMIGDMRDTEERQLLSPEIVAKNTEALKSQVSKLFAGQDFEVVNNADWLSKIELIPFLRDIGKNFNMAELISRDFFKSRINNGSGLSFAEFTYTLLQGYDFWYLYKNNGVSLQIGGSDQWGNLLSGVNLIRKKEGAEFLLNSDDQSVFEYLKILTTLSKEEIKTIEKNHQENQHLRIAQKALAKNVVEIVHGEEVAKNVISATEVLFGGKAFENLNKAEIEVLKYEIPVTSKDKTVSEILIETNFARSKGEAKRLISANSISFNSNKLQEDIQITEKGLLKKGKNSFILID